MAYTTRERVRELLDRGVGTKEVARTLGICASTVCYHKAKLGFPMQTATRYDWAAVQQYYDTGHTVSECIDRFGFTRGAWFLAVQRGAIVPRPQTMPLDELLIIAPRSRGNIKERLVAAGIKRSRCERCGIDQWCDQPLSPCLHHVNGDRHDNRLENLQLLCPNCHSQTPNFGVKNRQRRAA